MSDCPRVADALTADIETLRSRSDSDLARHIATCPDCGMAAARILAATAALAEALDDAPTPDPALMTQRARERELRRTGLRDFMHARSRWVLPLAGAAAGAVALYLTLATPGPTLEAEPWAPPLPGPPPLVDAPGHDIVVFPTTDPDITIIWLVKGEIK